MDALAIARAQGSSCKGLEAAGRGLAFRGKFPGSRCVTLRGIGLKI